MTKSVEKSARRELVALAVTALTACTLAHAEDNGGWDHYGGGQHGMQYSSLDQINRDNVGKLEEAWRYETGELGKGAQEPFAFQANPILAEGTLYLATGSAIVIALDPATGAELWRHDPHLDRNKHYSEIANRGVSSWVDPGAEPDAPCRHRIFVGTLDARVIALDGATGTPCEDFGDHGQIWLNRDVGAELGDAWVNYAVTSPPVIVGDVLVVGSSIGDNRSVQSELGIVRGIDARSGEERWRWDPVPRDANDPAHASWRDDEAARNGSGNAWAPLAADAQRGLVYVPTGSASPDFYGGERTGDDLYTDSLVALQAATGMVVWYRQLVHHDLWDYDLASQPTLVELEHDGVRVPAVLQGTKAGFIFSFNRVTGAPLFPIEERPVPQGGVAGEQLSPTQPFPAAPPPVSRQEPVTADDAWGVLYFDKSACRRKLAGLRSEGIFTPPSIRGTLEMPSYAGGINWGGLAFEPHSQVVVTFSLDVPTEVALIPRKDVERVRESGNYDGYQFSRMAGTPYGMRRALIRSPLGMPCTTPPWGRLTAIDMRKGRILWQRGVGTIQDVAPAVAPNLELGMAGLGGPIVTAGGLVFMAAVQDDYLRAFDLDDGKTLWEGRLPAGGQATPMTYYLPSTGRQYVVIAAGGNAHLGTTPGDYVVAYALPD
ncbi:MAG: pyrroloquinoline quinone-dependent dehydrogenase [Woeseiaceae bacterium]